MDYFAALRSITEDAEIFRNELAIWCKQFKDISFAKHEMTLLEKPFKTDREKGKLIYSVYKKTKNYALAHQIVYWWEHRRYFDQGGNQFFGNSKEWRFVDQFIEDETSAKLKIWNEKSFRDMTLFQRENPELSNPNQAEEAGN